MKFNINKPEDEDKIKKYYKMHILSLVIASIIFFLSICVLKFTEDNQIISTTLLLASFSLIYLFLYFALVYREADTEYSFLYRNYLPISPSKCKSVLTMINENSNIHSYVKLVNKECRQLYNYEYNAFLHELHMQKRQDTINEEKSHCHKLYNELK
jgi:hypothetical protein